MLCQQAEVPLSDSGDGVRQSCRKWSGTAIGDVITYRTDRVAMIQFPVIGLITPFAPWTYVYVHVRSIASHNHVTCVTNGQSFRLMSLFVARRFSRFVAQS